MKFGGVHERGASKDGVLVKQRVLSSPEGRGVERVQWMRRHSTNESKTTGQSSVCTSKDDGRRRGCLANERLTKRRVESTTTRRPKLSCCVRGLAGPIWRCAFCVLQLPELQGEMRSWSAHCLHHSTLSEKKSYDAQGARVSPPLQSLITSSLPIALSPAHHPSPFHFVCLFFPCCVWSPPATPIPKEGRRHHHQFTGTGWSLLLSRFATSPLFLNRRHSSWVGVV